MCRYLPHQSALLIESVSKLQHKREDVHLKEQCGNAALLSGGFQAQLEIPEWSILWVWQKGLTLDLVVLSNGKASAPALGHMITTDEASTYLNGSPWSWAHTVSFHLQSICLGERYHCANYWCGWGWVVLCSCWSRITHPSWAPLYHFGSELLQLELELFLGVIPKGSCNSRAAGYVSWWI